MDVAVLPLCVFRRLISLVSGVARGVEPREESSRVLLGAVDDGVAASDVPVAFFAGFFADALDDADSIVSLPSTFEGVASSMGEDLVAGGPVAFLLGGILSLPNMSQ